MKINLKNASGSEIISEPEKCFVNDADLKVGKIQHTIRIYVQIASDIPKDIRDSQGATEDYNKAKELGYE
ncbi:MAG: hypothetical protein AB7V50_03360 [Vampirovibrionia bacterium]